MNCVDHLTIDLNNYFGAYSMLFMDIICIIFLGLFYSGIFRIVFYKKIGELKQFCLKNLSITAIGFILCISATAFNYLYSSKLCVIYSIESIVLRVVLAFILSLAFTFLFLGYDIFKKIRTKQN